MHASDGSSGSSNRSESPLPGARPALVLLLLINLFNYVDRYVLAAVVGPIKETFFRGGAAVEGGSLGALMQWFQSRLGFKPEDALLGLLAMAFMVVYMVSAPVFARLAERRSRWALVGIGVILWSLASGASGLAATFLVLLITRCCVGIGEAAYGPVAPAMISDLYPVKIRGQVLSWFYIAIPVGSALGYVLGGLVKNSGIGEWGAGLSVCGSRAGAGHSFWSRCRGSRWGCGVFSCANRHAGRPTSQRPPSPRPSPGADYRGLAAHAVLRLLHSRHGRDDLRHRRHRVLDALLSGRTAGRAGESTVIFGGITAVGRPDGHLARRDRRRQAAGALLRLVFSGLRRGHAGRFPVLPRRAARSLSMDLAVDLPDVLLPVLQHGADEYDPGQRHVSIDACRRLRA